jgi:predicted methyltransferase
MREMGEHLDLPQVSRVNPVKWHSVVVCCSVLQCVAVCCSQSGTVPITNEMSDILKRRQYRQFRV